MIGKKKILLVCSPYYKDITSNLIKGASDLLVSKSVDYNILNVPELSKLRQQLSWFQIIFRNPFFDGFVALGCVIKGETYHFDIVANESSRALTDLSINYSTPIGNGILTVSDKDQAIKRSDPNQLNKGAGAALACLSLINIKNSIDYE